MGAIGFGLFMFGYGCIYYGAALVTGQHRNFMYSLFHVGASGSSSANTGSDGSTGSNSNSNATGGTPSGGGGALSA